MRNKSRGNVAKRIWEHNLNRNDPVIYKYECLLVQSTIHHEVYNAKHRRLRPLKTRYCGLDQLPLPTGHPSCTCITYSHPNLTHLTVRGNRLLRNRIVDHLRHYTMSYLGTPHSSASAPWRASNLVNIATHFTPRGHPAGRRNECPVTDFCTGIVEQAYFSATVSSGSL